MLRGNPGSDWVQGHRLGCQQQGEIVVNKFFISLCLVLALACGSVMAETSDAEQVPKAVIAQVEQDTGGRVLSAEVTQDGYQLKVLMPGGRVRIIQVAREE